MLCLVSAAGTQQAESQQVESRWNMARTYGYISGDSHLEVLPSRWAPHVAAVHRDAAPKDPKPFTTADGTVVMPYGGLGGREYPDSVEIGPNVGDRPGMGSPEQRVGELDTDGLDAEILFSGAQGPVAWRATIKDDDAYKAVVRGYNEFLWEEYCSAAPDRLLGLGMMPVTGVDDAIAEMEYCVRNGLLGVQLNAFPAGQSHPSPEDDRFWAASVDLRCPVTVHVEFNHPTVASAAHNGVSARSYGGGLAGPTFLYAKQPEQGFLDIIQRYAKYGFRGSLHVAQMIWAGVFDRFPDFQIYFAETQVGWIPNFLEQMDQHYVRHQKAAEQLLGLPALKQLPSEYVKEHVYWGFVYNPVGVRAMHREVGVDRIMWSSDFPHAESDWPNTAKALEESFAGIPEDAKQKMLTGNAVDFFHLATATLGTKTMSATKTA
jgi:predicted TIM-barrel fold metal-dependent hydrolase